MEKSIQKWISPLRDAKHRYGRNDGGRLRPNLRWGSGRNDHPSNRRNSLDRCELLPYPVVIISVRGYEKGVTGVEEKGMHRFFSPGGTA